MKWNQPKVWFPVLVLSTIIAVTLATAVEVQRTKASLDNLYQEAEKSHSWLIRVDFLAIIERTEVRLQGFSKHWRF